MTDRIPVAKTYKLFIDGKFPRTESGRYYALSSKGTVVANICRGSRKDFRNAVVAARPAFTRWSGATAYLRGQILYRAAELLEGRKDQFMAELKLEGVTRARAAREVEDSIDRLVYYAGWTDKYQQIFSSVNPVSSSHFNFSLLEPMGVVSILAPAREGLLGLVSTIAPVIAGGNSCVVLAAENHPLTAIDFAEVLHGSDVPGGVVNILTGLRSELVPHFASHMDVNAIVCCPANGPAHKDVQNTEKQQIQIEAAENLKRVIFYDHVSWQGDSHQSPWLIQDTQETKTTWHPIEA